MKHTLYKKTNRFSIAILTALLCLSISSCEELKLGNSFLDQQPEQVGITMDSIFDSELYASQVLNKSYTSLPYPIPYGNDYLMGGDLIEGITDLSYSTCHYAASRAQYYNGVYNPSTAQTYSKYYFSKASIWSGIRNAWLVVENIDKVPDMTSNEKDQAKAEAKMIVATHYADMLRHLGGVPIIDHAIDVNEEMTYPRATVAQTVTFITQLIDDAAPNLEWRVNSDTDDGRMTQAYAMGLKVRVLLFSASPLFNNSAPYLESDASANKLTWYGNYSIDRWKDAEKAGKAFFDALDANGDYNLVKAESNTQEGYRKAFHDAYFTRRNSEVLLSIRTNFKNNYSARFCGGSDNFARAQTPTLRYVNLFPKADGSDFPSNFDWSNVNEDPFANRDPRFYETILTNGRPYAGGTSELFVGGNQRKDANSDGTGFLMYKFSQDYTSATSIGAVDNYPHLRLSEVYLSYAEAINEANGGPNTVAYDCVNTVRNRVGLGNLTSNLNQEQFRKALLKERACELGYEGCHWFDIIRWKNEEAFKADIQGLNLYTDASQPTGYKYETFTISPARVWKNTWNTKWYLSAFPKVDMEKNYGLIQNPGW